jgi:anthranilate phosphoribosyltransferase
MKEQEVRLPEQSTSHFRLKGYPYQQVLEDGTVLDCNVTLDRLAQGKYRRELGERVKSVETYLDPLRDMGYNGIHSAIQGGDLTFDQAFSMATFVCAALNNPLREELRGAGALPELETHVLQATSLLSAMSVKESLVGLTPDEIAGMVAATIHLDTVARVPHEEPVIAFGGMGGDKGYPLNGDNSKLFSLSTLSAVVLADAGPVHKHHSYPNTSKVAGQSAIEAFGARSDFDSVDVMTEVMGVSNLLMTSCHSTRTLHTLSHVLKGETINHVIGPLAFTLDAETPIHAMIGVNEKIPPETIVESMKILNDKGFQKYGNSAVFCGTDLTGEQLEQAKAMGTVQEHVRLDEVAPAPYASIAAFLVDGENAGTFVIAPEDFYDEETLGEMNLEELEIHNSVDEIIAANIAAITGANRSQSLYLAMCVGLGLFTRDCLTHPDALDRSSRRVNRDYLRQCTSQGLAMIESGRAAQSLQRYVGATQQVVRK